MIWFSLKDKNPFYLLFEIVQGALFLCGLFVCLFNLIYALGNSIFKYDPMSEDCILSQNEKSQLFMQ